MTKENTRQRLIDAAYEEIYSHGYQGAALTDILKRAGVHKGSMYHFFANKKEMALSAVHEKIEERLDTRYRAVLDGGAPYLPRFFAMLHDTSERDFRRGCPIANLVQEMSNLDEDFDRAMKAVYDRFREVFRGIYARAVASGELAACDTGRLARFSLIVLEGAILSAKATGEPSDYLEAVDMLEEYLSRYRRSA